ncbi:hypothetical protein PYW07_000344 [Mythimna separata]|uniref:Gag-like protein n=1 Tax=Mythimna separata TaxID=271217 RepID=A0AAD7Z1E9_MYTSE|nr:hypothetical protein PYW07_000344 [Mythimna separata]
MSITSGGEEPPEPGEKKKRKYHNTRKPDSNKYKIFTKPNYKRLFIENTNSEYIVYVESTEQEKVGNKNPITFTNLITDNVKGVLGVHRINAHKIGITFRKAAAANNFLKMEDFLWKNKLKAFIPSYLTERIGVLRFVPKELSNEEIYKNIVCDSEVISVKRFMRKEEGHLVPLNTITVTFASTSLPQYAYIKLFRYEVKAYIPPLLQCYKCLKFNHSAKACRGEQNCSSCAGRHSYKECDVEEITCINCAGNHLAISRDCPIKKQKIEEKKAKFLKQKSYATVVNSPLTFNEKSFPVLPKVTDKVKPNDTLDTKLIANNEIIINAIVKSLVELGNKSESDGPLTHKKIKEIFLSNLI